MDHRIPTRLKKEPLLEVVWEVRFSGAKLSVADLLPGMLFKALPGRYGNIVRLPAANIPAAAVEHDPNLRYMPRIRLESDNQAVQVGEHMVSLSCRRPYSGWSKFSSDIRDLAKAVRDTGLISTLERFSLKYINMFESDQSLGAGCLNLDFKLGEYEISKRPLHFRTEIKEGDLSHIIQITSPVEASLPGVREPLKGVLLDIDSVKNLEENESWDGLDSRLDDVHTACKRIFFSLVKPETISELEPEYGG